MFQALSISVSSLLVDQKFLLLLLDVVVSAVLFFVGKYAAPGIFEDVKFMIGILQPVIIALIGSIALENYGDSRAAGDWLAAVMLSEEQEDDGAASPDRDLPCPPMCSGTKEADGWSGYTG